MEMFNTLNRQQQPYIQSGYGAMGRLNTLLGLNPRPTPAVSPAVAGGPVGIPPGLERLLGRNANTSTSHMLQGALGQVLAQAGDSSSSPAYMPTASGGVRPIMQVGSQASTDPQRRLKDLLAFRASNGDRQSRALLERMS
jgi:hypothetical protein